MCETRINIDVVLYLTSTSNHNLVKLKVFCNKVVLYLTSTSNHNQRVRHFAKLRVVLYLTSTSNHNKRIRSQRSRMLCYILLLHQTTTYMR